MSLPTATLGLIKASEGEPYDLDVINNNLDSVDTEVLALRKMGKGLVARTFDGNTSPNFNNAEGLVNYALVNVVAGRWYEFKFRANVVSAGVNQPIQIWLKRDSDTNALTTFTTGGTIVNISSIDFQNTGPSTTQPSTINAGITFQAPSTESLLLKVTGRLVSAGTNFTWVARSITLVDLGAQF